MAIYQAKFLQPQNSTINGALINTFSFVCQGTTITKYNAKIYRVSDNVQVYTTGDVVLSPVKYNNEIVTFNVPVNTMTNGVQYKWDVTTFENATSVTSLQVVFIANAAATLTMTVPATITTQEYTFTATYAQANNVPIQYFYFVLKSNGVEIDRTDLTFSGNITHKFSGFVSGNSYSVQVFGATNNGALVESPVYNFNVSYTLPSIKIKPTLNQDCKTGFIDVIWGATTQINGSVNGSYEFLQNYVIQGNWALKLLGNSYYTANLTIPVDMSVVVPIEEFNPPIGTGTIIELLGTTTYTFGFDSVAKRFYFVIGGISGYSDQLTTIPSKFIAFLNPTNAYVKLEDGTIYELKDN